MDMPLTSYEREHVARLRNMADAIEQRKQFIVETDLQEHDSEGVRDIAYEMRVRFLLPRDEN